MRMRIQTYNNEHLPVKIEHVPQRGGLIHLDDDNVYVIDLVVYRYVNGVDDLCDVYVEKKDVEEWIPIYVENLTPL